MRKIILAAFCISVLVLGSFGLNNHAQANPQVIPDNYIIVFKNSVSDSQGKANEMANNYGLSVSHVYSHAINGFSATIPQQALQKILNDPNVSFVESDQIVSIDNNSGNGKGSGGGKPSGGSTTQPPQVIPTGISRINGPASDMSTSNIGVAVIDTGIDSKHPDLNVVGGTRCVTGKGGYNDDNGHGTHVSGTIGAKNNDIGVVGVAPGVKLYAAKVLDRTGSGTTSSVICGIDWVIANNDKIKVANLSLGGGASDALDTAVQNAISNGITMVVAAGNSYANVSTTSPARVADAITVSALADFDGLPGGLGSPTCRSDQDDTFADFSNYGSGVDIIAPGVCILSTWKGSSYNTISGTSMATPHVTGAAAVYLQSHNSASPLEVANALKSNGNLNYFFPSQDPDGIQEPLLDLTNFK